VSGDLLVAARKMKKRPLHKLLAKGLNVRAKVIVELLAFARPADATPFAIGAASSAAQPCGCVRRPAPEDCDLPDFSRVCPTGPLNHKRSGTIVAHAN
jgi:hypothetical protein